MRSRLRGVADIKALFSIGASLELLGHFPALLGTHSNVLEDVPLLRFRERACFVDNPSNHLVLRRSMVGRLPNAVNRPQGSGGFIRRIAMPGEPRGCAYLRRTASRLRRGPPEEAGFCPRQNRR